MNYFTDPSVDGKVRGEICIRGASVIPGYFDNPKQTSEIID
jgi:long-subunit acyl-CoA synthetase (AMP-forming)